MPNLDKKNNKQNISDLELLLLVEMGFFSNLKKAKLKFNPRPSSDPKHLQIEPIDWSFDTGFLERLKGLKLRFNPKPSSEPQSNQPVDTNPEHVVDLHIEIAKKVDELIASREKELQEEVEPVTQMQQQLTLQEFVEFREISVKRPEMPQFNTEINPENVFREVHQEEELFEIVPPTETQPIEQNQQVDNDFHSTMIQDVQKSHKLFMGASHVQIKTKSPLKKANKTEKTRKKLNGFTKKQIELEKTKQEIEARRIALKEAKEEEKAKEEELKKAREEKIKQDKLKKLLQKKREHEKKLKERELKKAEKLRQIELRKLEKEKLHKLREKEKETEKAERLKQIELKKLERGRLLKDKEKEKLEKLKLKEEAKKQKEKLEELKKKEKLKHKEAEKIKAKKPNKEKLSLFGKKKEKKKKKEEKPATETEEKPLEIDELIKEKVTTNQKPVLDDDVEQLLPILDQLLENLPEEVIDEFAHSDDFNLYEKVMRKYQNK